MAQERPVVNVTPDSRIKSQAELDAEAVRSNTGTGDDQLRAREEMEDLLEAADGQQDPRGERFAEVEMSDEEAEARRRIEEFMKLPAEERVARMAVVLDRGIVHDRLKVDLPPDLHGEWVRDDPLEIDRMRTLGFWVDETYATRRVLHSDGTSANKVADVIHMVTMKKNKEMIDQVYLEKQVRATRRPKKAQEDEEFAEATARDTGGIIPTFSESNQRTLTAADVRAALARANGQTVVQRG